MGTVRRRAPEPEKPTGVVRRRPRPVNEREPESHEPKALLEAQGPRQPSRMQDVTKALGTPRFVGVDPVAAEKALMIYLRADKGEVRPYCTHISGGFVFEPQYGCYVHSDPKCWKPSKAMYEVCLRAGILGDVKTK